MKIILILLFAITVDVSAEIFKWVDERGKIHFGDKDSKPANAGKISVETIVYSMPSPVIMYSATWCGICKSAARYFRRNKIQYVEYMIDKDPIAKKRYRRFNASGVPVIQYKDRTIRGFDIERFENIYP